MKTLAPNLFELLDFLCEKTPSDEIISGERDAREKSWNRPMVMALSILANLNTKRFNVVQAPLFFFLVSKGVTKRVFEVLDLLGISTRYVLAGKDAEHNAWRKGLEEVAHTKLKDEFGWRHWNE
jgi:hypothetical protein